MAAGSLGLLGATPQAGEHGGRQPTAGPGSRQGLRQAAVTFAAVLAALLAQAAAFATLTAHAAAGAAALAAAVALLLRAAADMPQGPLASPQACEHAPLRSRGSSDAGVIVEVTAARPAAAGKAGCQATATAAPPAGASPAETQAAAARAPGTALTSSTGMRAYAEAVAAGEHAAQVAEAGPDAALCSPCSSASGSLSSAAAGLSAAPAPSSHALAQPVSAAAAAVAATAAASVPAHCPLRPLPAAAGAAAAGQQPRAPTLVSDPEPEWLNADVKQRCAHCVGTGRRGAYGCCRSPPAPRASLCSDCGPWKCAPPAVGARGDSVRTRPPCRVPQVYPGQVQLEGLRRPGGADARVAPAAGRRRPVAGAPRGVV